MSYWFRQNIIKRERVVKFNPNHDDHGRFTDGMSNKEMFADSLGITRGDMPQIPNNLKDKFVAELKAEGVSSKKELVPARSLKPTQGDYNDENIAFVRQEHRAGRLDGKSNPIVVSNDNRILDGHHRWVVLAQDNQPIHVVRVDLPIKELLARASKFNDENGVQRRSKDTLDFKKSDVWGLAA